MIKRVLFLLFVVILSACGSQTPPTTKKISPTTAAVPTTVPATTEATTFITETIKATAPTTETLQATAVVTPTMPEGSDVSTTPTGSPYPMPPTNTPWKPAYPMPQPTIAYPPTPEKLHSNETGAIKGVMLDKEGTPIATIHVYLAVISPEGIISYTTDSKRGFTYGDGTFYITDVQPGTYALSVWSPNDSVLVPEPQGPEDSALKVEVKAGEVVDLGTLNIRRPK